MQEQVQQAQSFFRQLAGFALQVIYNLWFYELVLIFAFMFRVLATIMLRPSPYMSSVVKHKRYIKCYCHINLIISLPHCAFLCLFHNQFFFCYFQVISSMYKYFLYCQKYKRVKQESALKDNNFNKRLFNMRISREIVDTLYSLLWFSTFIVNKTEKKVGKYISLFFRNSHFSASPHFDLAPD